MVRILIKWRHSDLEVIASTGIVTIYDSAKNTFLGEWLIEVDKNSTHHKPQGNDQHLPPIQEILGGEVDQLARAYMSGYDRDETVHHWIAPLEPEKIEEMIKTEK